MEKRHLNSEERLWIAGEIHKLLRVTRDSAESLWADNLIRGAYLWFWTTDGINKKGKLRRDLFKTDTDFVRHTDAAKVALQARQKVIHEHAVPRKVILSHLKSKTWESDSEIKAFLDRFCFGIVIDKKEEPNFKDWKQNMPNAFSENSDPLDRYVAAGVKVNVPKYARSE